LRDEGVFGGEQDGGPGDGGGDDADGVAAVAVVAAVAGPFETPVDGAEEGDDLAKRMGFNGCTWGEESWRGKDGMGGTEGKGTFSLVPLLPGGWGRKCAYDGAVADLQRLEDVQPDLGRALGHDETGTGVGGVVDLPGAVHGGEGGGQVWQDAGEADAVGFGGDVLQRERVPDGFLR